MYTSWGLLPQEYSERPDESFIIGSTYVCHEADGLVSFKHQIRPSWIPAVSGGPQ